MLGVLRRCVAAVWWGMVGGEARTGLGAQRGGGAYCRLTVETGAVGTEMLGSEADGFRGRGEEDEA